LPRFFLILKKITTGAENQKEKERGYQKWYRNQGGTHSEKWWRVDGRVLQFLQKRGRECALGRQSILSDVLEGLDLILARYLPSDIES
jgi:hypothetical protein